MTTSDRCAVFFDRDGVLNHSYTSTRGTPCPPRTLSELRVYSDAIAGCKSLKAAGFLLICVSNQPDISRGTMEPHSLSLINEAVSIACGLDDMLVCMHDDADACVCRKPKPGLITQAAKTHRICLAASYMVGDRWRDIDAGLAAGCKTIFIDRDYNERKPNGMNYTCDCIRDACEWILADFQIIKHVSRHEGPVL
jgi:D-glycero-D-manno-heptose 1,7-bisphosphate phosphatase